MDPFFSSYCWPPASFCQCTCCDSLDCRKIPSSANQTNRKMFVLHLVRKLVVISTLFWVVWYVSKTKSKKSIYSFLFSIWFFQSLVGNLKSQFDKVKFINLVYANVHFRSLSTWVYTWQLFLFVPLSIRFQLSRWRFSYVSVAVRMKKFVYQVITTTDSPFSSGRNNAMCDEPFLYESKTIAYALENSLLCLLLMIFLRF